MLEKTIRIDPDHSKEVLFEAFGLTEEDADDITRTILKCMVDGGTLSEIIEHLVEKYEGNKLVIALYTLGRIAEILENSPFTVKVSVGNEIQETMSEAFRRMVK